MELHRNVIVGLLHLQGRHDTAARARRDLPARVDSARARHARLLASLGTDLHDLLSSASTRDGDGAHSDRAHGTDQTGGSVDNADPEGPPRHRRNTKPEPRPE